MKMESKRIRYIAFTNGAHENRAPTGSNVNNAKNAP